MAIYGIGADIVEVRRMADILSRHGDRFAQHILSPRELADYARTRFPARFLAKRFAAKEAFAKALGTGFRHPVTVRHITVVHDALGKPGIAPEAELAHWVQGRGIGPIHLSVSDEKDLVAAFVVLECL